MEEDLKILEKAIKVLTGRDTGIKLDFEATAQAIENLIKGYRALEEKNKNMAEGYLVNNPGLAKYLKENYIFKSKVKEKIEELNSKSGGNIYHVQATINAQKRVLQELLGDEE